MYLHTCPYYPLETSCFTFQSELHTLIVILSITTKTKHSSLYSKTTYFVPPPSLISLVLMYCYLFNMYEYSHVAGNVHIWFLCYHHTCTNITQKWIHFNFCCEIGITWAQHIPVETPKHAIPYLSPSFLCPQFVSRTKVSMHGCCVNGFSEYDITYNETRSTHNFHTMPATRPTKVSGFSVTCVIL